MEMPWPDDDSSHSIVAIRTGHELILGVDGMLGTNLSTALIPNFGSAHSVAVGADPMTGRGIVGVLDRVRIANRALSQAEWIPSPAHFEGVPVLWWQKYFGAEFTNNESAHADIDADDDGSTNEKEFRVGGNPVDPLSGFHAMISNSGVIAWRSVPGASYRVFHRSSAGDQPIGISQQIIAAAGITSFSIPLGEANSGFYSVQASSQP